MARYYFDTRGSRGARRDGCGEDLGDFEEARRRAQCLLSDIIREELPDGDWHDVCCDVRDETGRVVYQGEITYRGTAW